MDPLVESKATLKTPAYAAKKADTELVPWSIERREPGPHDLLIDILYCGVCHSDIHQVKHEWHNEIIGRVVKVGDHVKKWKPGHIVDVGCFRRCEACLAGEEQYCEIGMSLTYNGYEQDKETPTYGGYSTRITVDENYILSTPQGIPLERAAPLLCAGITTYSPLKHFGLEAGDRLGVVGLGGLGHMAVKFGHAMGAHVTVLSHSPGKRDDALALGADDFLVTKDEAVFKDNANRFDFIIDTISATHDYNTYLNLLRRDGIMVLVGLPDPTPLSAGPLIMKRRSLAGSLIGGIRETQEILDFCGRHNVAADVEVIPIQEINRAYQRMLKNDVRYRFVIDLASLKAGAP